MKNKVLSNTENLERKIGGNNYDDAARSRARAKRCTDDVMFPALYINYLLAIMVTNSTIAYTTHHSFNSASVYFSTSISSHKHQTSSLQKLIQVTALQKKRKFQTFPDVSSHCFPSGGLFSLYTYLTTILEMKLTTWFFLTANFPDFWPFH